jgi:hypothetical protein
MRALYSLSLWIIGLQLQSSVAQTGENNPSALFSPISFQSSNGSFTEQYIPEGKQFSILQSESDSHKVLALIYPFFQELSISKSASENSLNDQKNVRFILDGLFLCQIYQPQKNQQQIHSFASDKGQDVVWHKWISKSDTAQFLKDIRAEYSPALSRELIINKSLTYIHSLGLTAVETANILEKKPGRIFYSTTTDMKAGDCFMVIIPHQPFNPDSIKTRTLLYAREGIETKIYTDEILLNWQYADIGKGAFFIANVQHKQQFGADLSFEVYSKDKQSIPDATMVIVKKAATQQARAGYNAKRLYQADEWHKYIQSLQREFKEQQIAEQLKRKTELSNILSGRTFRLAIQQNGQFREISSQSGSVIYQVSDRFYLVMNAGLEYALLDMENTGLELEFHFSKAEYFPSIHLLALTGKHPHKGLIIHTENGQKTSGSFSKITVRNMHLYASTAHETIVFSDKGLLNRIPLSDKVLYESPDGQYYAVKHEGRGEIFTADKQRITSSNHFFTQFGGVDNQGIILGKANQAMAAALNDPSLVHTMHFYKFKGGQPVLVAKAGCSEAQYLGGGKVACKINENTWHLYTQSGSRLQSQTYSNLDNLLTSLQVNKSDLIWNNELRPAALKTAAISSPEKADWLPVSNPSANVLGVFGPKENRIWVIQ